MLCTKHTRSQYQQFALEMTLKIIFERMEGVRPKALVISLGLNTGHWKMLLKLIQVVGRWWMVNDNKQLAWFCYCEEGLDWPSIAKSSWHGKRQIIWSYVSAHVL